MEFFVVSDFLGFLAPSEILSEKIEKPFFPVSFGFFLCFLLFINIVNQRKVPRPLTQLARKIYIDVVLFKFVCF